MHVAAQVTVVFPTRRIVENLAYNVSQEDIHELFDTCGPLRYAELQYDRRCAPHVFQSFQD